MTSDVLVIGGGIGGLVVARRLAVAGRRVTVFERSDTLGGQVARVAVGGLMVDAAAESFATRGGDVARLAAELGLADRIITPSGSAAWVYRSDGTAVPLPATGLMGIPGAPFAPDVVRALGRYGALRAAMDGVLPARVGGHATSIGQLVRARMGRRVVDRLVGPIVRGVHSTTADALPLDRVAPRLQERIVEHGSLAGAVRALRAQAPAGAQVASFDGGLHTLVSALVDDGVRHGAIYRTGAEVTDITAETAVVDGERHRGTVVRAFGDPAPDRRRVTLVTLVVEGEGLGEEPRGTGLLVADRAPGIRARALTHMSAKWAWIREAAAPRHVLRLSYDGEPEAPVAQARVDAAALLGARIDTVHDAAVLTWDRGVVDTPGVLTVGESRAGTGLAAVVSHAERVAADIVSTSSDDAGRGRIEG
ncbi:protoporphyrinogen/coproporphyrinogen oxidase [Microbacterium koreense]|uniref:Protoporphyrinogen/coproporphyrinogen oxidase n=1 Tax=Microbacterium koreense TaxID=323761 RepID=A0ABW2ZQT8_9MICO